MRIIAISRAHRAMKRQTLGLHSHVCPVVDEKVAAVKAGTLSLDEFRAWLGQLHTDYVSALEQSENTLVKTRIRLVVAERSMKVKLPTKKKKG